MNLSVRHIFFVGLLCFYFLHEGKVNAQTIIKHHEVVVKPQKIAVGKDKYIQSFSFENAQFQTDEMLPYFNSKELISNLKSVKDVLIKNEKWVEIDFPLNQKILNSINEKVEIKYAVSEQRKQNYLIYSILPYRNHNDKVEYLASFDIEIITEDVNVNVAKKSALASSFNTNSVLKSGSGSWYRLAVLNDGVYKISYSYLENLGIDVSNINSSSLNIFGNGTGLLSEFNSDLRIDDLAKNAIKIVDGGDGKFDNGDYILFYAKGPHIKKMKGVEFIHVNHIYSDSSFYFLNINSSAASERILPQAQSAKTVTKSISTFDELKYIEKDKENLLTSGRRWFGDHFDATLTQVYEFNFPNINTSIPIKVKFVGAGRSFNSATNYTIKELNSGASFSSAFIPTTAINTYAIFAKEVVENLTYNATSAKQRIQVTFNKQGSPEAEGWLDYVALLANRKLIMTSNQMEFSSLASVGAGEVSKFSLSNAQDVIEIWDVTNPRKVSKLTFTDLGSIKEFTVDTDTLRTFVALSNTSNFSEPIYSKRIQHQNLHALPYADLIIISPQEFFSNAEELKTVHEGLGHKVHLVTDEEVYNEFSSGMPDATAIKHFMKMF